MTDPANPVLAEVWRGEILECVHRGTAVVATAAGEVVEAWGDPARVILPRSSFKMIQALPLVESGAADAAGLGSEHLALACASHSGARVHTGLAASWLAGIGLAEHDLRCGAHTPGDPEAAHALYAAGAAPGQFHNNCSGKHCGFLTMNRRLRGDAEYLELDHPLQQAVRLTVEEVTGETVSGHAIDGCSAPNFATSLRGLATAMARFATAGASFTGASFTGARAGAARRLVEAMAAHPVLVGGAGRATTNLIRACAGRAVVKAGAEGVYIAILPGRGLGMALKIDDGNARGSEAAIAALLARHGALERHDPVFAALADAPILNCRGFVHGHLRAAETLLG
ncbi:MAG: asparaginase [Proteobacteria bacterium]|nr:asparaginase [Pseudomonadota bacterium]